MVKLLHALVALAIIGWILTLQLEALWTAPIWVFTSYMVCVILLQPRLAFQDSQARERDRGTSQLIGAATVLSQAFALMEALSWNYPQSVGVDVTFWAGLLVAGLGLALRVWAVRALGRFFSMQITLQEGHPVIEEGPFRWVRHPSYLGALLLFLGNILLLHSWRTLAVASLVLPLVYWVRVHLEERLLLAELPGYADYRRRVGAFFPRPGRGRG